MVRGNACLLHLSLWYCDGWSLSTQGQVDTLYPHHQNTHTTCKLSFNWHPCLLMRLYCGGRLMVGKCLHKSLLSSTVWLGGEHKRQWMALLAVAETSIIIMAALLWPVIVRPLSIGCSFHTRSCQCDITSPTCQPNPSLNRTLRSPARVWSWQTLTHSTLLSDMSAWMRSAELVRGVNSNVWSCSVSNGLLHPRGNRKEA